MRPMAVFGAVFAASALACAAAVPHPADPD
jgi:hypothetical protein